MKGHGQYHAGGSNLPDDRDLLRGVLAGDREAVVRPDNRCSECDLELERTGKTIPLEDCWHRHWRVAGETSAPEVR